MTTDTPAAPESAAQGNGKGNDMGARAALAGGGPESGGQRLPADVPVGSRLAHLKAMRDERLEREELRLPVPTWRGGLVAVLRPMSIEERKDFASRMSAGKFDEITMGAEFIAACCTGVELRGEDGALVSVKDEATGLPALLNPSFAEQLGYKGVSTNAGCVQSLVNWNVAAIEGMFEKLHEWSRDTSMDVEGAILGE